MSSAFIERTCIFSPLKQVYLFANISFNVMYEENPLFLNVSFLSATNDVSKKLVVKHFTLVAELPPQRYVSGTPALGLGVFLFVANYKIHNIFKE